MIFNPLASDCENDILHHGVFEFPHVRGSLSFTETMNSSKFLPIVVFCVLFGGTMLVASTFVTDESDAIYGKGVHAFFDRNYEEAVKILSDADKLDTADPRPYYFLGLAYLRQKKTERADHYIEKAAKLEYSGRAPRDYAVSESLRRIQGEERQRIEKIRSEERINAQIREQRLLEIRYGKESATGREHLRQPVTQNRKEDLTALQQVAESFGENAFGARAIDPTGTSDAIAARKRSEDNPFGEIVANIDALPKVVEIKPSAGRENTPAKRRENVGTPTAASVGVVRNTQAMAAKELGKGLRALFANATEEIVPTVTAMEPANGATDVNAESVSVLRITFDVDMNTASAGWVLNPDTSPRATGTYQWIDDQTCELPVGLESGREYTLRINVPNRPGFRSKEGVPTQTFLYKFSTQ